MNTQTPFEPGWLAGQRWFRAKQRRIASVAEVDSAPLDGAVLHVVEVAYADDEGGSDRYLLPMVDRREPHDGEGAWSAIVRAMADGRRLAGRAGGFVCRHTDALVLDRPLRERRLRVEQSNTSVTLGEELILKIYRLLEPGDNPDLEVSAFLTDVGFADTPPVGGWMTYAPNDGPEAAAAMVQAYVRSTGDAWDAMLRALASHPDRAARLAGQIGRVTRTLHDALAARPDDPAFPARSATPAETAAWRESAERQLTQAITAVSGAAHQRLVALAPRVTAQFADSFGAAAGEARVTRIHGDYHLGQLLARTDGGFSVIDFEGEPARPLPERRAPASPLRDVAGMLRSLDYAARTAARDATDTAFDAAGWVTRARDAFLDGYGGIGSDAEALLAAFELEKACYEVRYEAGNRPAWLWLPLDAVERLAAA